MSNTLSIVQGTSQTFNVTLTDGNGAPLRLHRLQGAVAQLLVRVQPTDDMNVLAFTSTANPNNLYFQRGAPVLVFAFLPTDTSSLTLGLYYYQIQLTLEDGTIQNPVDWNLLDLNLGGAAATPPPPFPSTVTITADYPLPGDMLYQTPGGCGIEGAQVRVYYQSDYQAGRLSSPVGITTTGRGGKWTNPILVTPGFTYVAQFMFPGEWGPDVFTFFA